MLPTDTRNRIRSSIAVLAALGLLAVLGCAASFELNPPFARASDDDNGGAAPVRPEQQQHWDVNDEWGRSPRVASASGTSSEPSANRPATMPAVAARRSATNLNADADVSDHDDDHDDDDRAPSTLPAAATITDGAMQLSDAPPMDNVVRQSNADEVEIVRVLKPVNGTAVYFGQIRGAADPKRKNLRGKSTPIIATRSAGDRWRAMEVSDARAADTTWAYVGAGPQRGHAWGVLDGAPRRPGASGGGAPSYLILTHSADSGATWRTVPLLKPSPSAQYESICMGPYHGRVTLHQPAGEPAARAGFYHYQTDDHGRTWSPPTFEPDSLTPADTVGDVDQPRLPGRAPARAADAK